MKLADFKVGTRVGRLTVLSIIPRERPRTFQKCVCRCDCGNISEKFIGNLAQGHTQSCGCLRSYNTTAIKTTHGMRHSSEYGIWSGLKDRCYNPKNGAYAEYGGRGISVCQDWSQSFESFMRDIGPRPSKEHSIERLNNNGNYESGNCVWGTRFEQANNKRNNHLVTANGRTQNVTQWASELNCEPKMLFARLKFRSLEEIIATSDVVRRAWWRKNVLTASDAKNILTMLRGGWSGVRLAVLFGVSPGNINHIKKGRNWRSAQSTERLNQAATRP